MRKIIAALVATTALGAAAAGAQPAAAQAGCTQWSIGKGTIAQSNGFAIKLPSQQKNNTLSGDVTAIGRSSRMFGNLQGKVTGDSFRFTISWRNGSAGVYTGTIDEDGFAEGTTVDRFNRTSRASFTLYGRAICRY